MYPLCRPSFYTASMANANTPARPTTEPTVDMQWEAAPNADDAVGAAAAALLAP